MYSIILAINLLAIFLWFNTSKKVKFTNRHIWFEKLLENKKTTQIIVTILAILSLLLTVTLQGFGAGVFAWIIYSMGLLSLLVLIFPYQYIRFQHIFLLFAFFLFIELTSSYILTH